MRPAPPPHIRSSAAPRPAPRSRGARPAMAPVGERLAAAVARAIEGHDCTRRAPQVRPWRTTAADKASSARTRLELHERSSSQPVRAKKPPPPSAHPRHAPARVDRRGRPSAPPPRAPRARRRRRRRRSVSPARHRRRASPRHPSPDAPGADGTPAKAEQRPPIRVSPDAAPSVTPSPDTGHWWRCTSASPPSPPAPRPRSAAGAACAPRPRPPPRPLRLSSSGSDVSRGERIVGERNTPLSTPLERKDMVHTRGARAVQPCHRLSRLGARRFVWVHTVAGGGARRYFSRCSCR